MTPLVFMLYGTKSGHRYGASTGWMTDVGIVGSAAPAHGRQEPSFTWPLVPALLYGHLPALGDVPGESVVLPPPKNAQRVTFAVNVVSMPPYGLEAAPAAPCHTQPPT